MPNVITTALANGSGGIVGLVLGLVGGGGSILVVPLLVYVVGMPSAHVAIGTSAVAVIRERSGKEYEATRGYERTAALGCGMLSLVLP